MPSNLRSAFSVPHNRDTEDMLYSTDNPDFALTNAMADVGYNPYVANPFTASLKRMAPSMATAYLTNQAGNMTTTGPTGIARTGYGYSPSGPSSMSFSDYLRFNLTGEAGEQKYNAPGGTPGTPGNDLANGMFAGGPRGDAAVQLEYSPNTFKAIRDYRNQLGAGNVNAQNLNPFMAALSDQAGANNGMGTVDIMSNLISPFLAPGMARAYRGALTTSAQQAVRRLASEGPGSQNDIWTYLLGI
jgi:hypothetical protein